MIKKIFFICILLGPQSLFAQDIKANKDLQRPNPVTLVTASSSDAEIIVSWKLPDDKSVVAAHLYRKTYELPMQSSKGLDLGQLIAQLDVSQSRFTDSQVEIDKRYYYRVVVLSKNDKKSNPSLPAIASLKDSAPPLPVASINAKVVNATQLNLRWTASESDDVVAYRIYRAKKKSPAVIVKIISLKKKGERFFNTTIKQKKNLPIIYHYAVAAVDAAGNVAPLSGTVSIRLPDSIAPASPLLLASRQKQGYLNLSWLENTENDIDGYRIYRKKADDLTDNFTLLHKGLVKINQFIDSSIASFANYRYRVAAVDKYGNESKAGRGLAVRTLQFDEVIPAPTRLLIKTDKKGYPLLKWKLKNKLGKFKIRVFRNDGGEFMVVSSLLNNNRFTDTSVIAGRAYKYQIKTVSAVGQLSAGSNTVMWTGGGK